VILLHVYCFSAHTVKV